MTLRDWGYWVANFWASTVGVESGVEGLALKVYTGFRT